MRYFSPSDDVVTSRKWYKMDRVIDLYYNEKDDIKVIKVLRYFKD